MSDSKKVSVQPDHVYHSIDISEAIIAELKSNATAANFDLIRSVLDRLWGLELTRGDVAEQVVVLIERRQLSLKNDGWHFTE